MTDFDRAMEFVFKWEGGYGNDPKDPGGETNFGISKRQYPTLIIKDVTQEEAKDIYEVDYWKKSGADALLWPMNLIVFDTAVNMGVSKAKAILSDNPYWRDYIIARIETYTKYRGFNTFGHGWINRVIALYHLAGDEHPISYEEGGV